MGKKLKRLDTHHLCWYRKAWTTSYAHQVREHWYMKVTIPRDGLHIYIHNNLECIPVPSQKVLKKAWTMLLDLESAGALYKDDPIETRLEIAALLFEEAPATRKAFKRQLGLVRSYRPP